MEDADQVQAIGIDPFKGIVLFLSVHPESYGTLFCVAHPEHSLDRVLSPGQQTAGLQRRLGCYMMMHRLPMCGFQFQDLDHSN